MYGLCLKSNIFYQATIKYSSSKYKQKKMQRNMWNDIQETLWKPQKIINLIKSKNGTTLSIEYWILKQKQQVPIPSKEIKGQYPTLQKYNLCLNEKLAITDNPDKELVNKRSEVISQCCHRNKFKLVNLT